MIDWNTARNATLVTGGIVAVIAAVCLLLLWSPWVLVPVGVIATWLFAYYMLRSDL